MANSKHIPQGLVPVECMSPATDAAGRTGTYVSLKYAQRAYIVAYITQGNAATILLTPNQASAVAGTGTKVINAVPIWSNLDMAAGTALTRRTDAANYTTDAGVKHKVVVFEIDPAALDIANGFNCITLITGASNVANITSAMIWIEPRYAQDTAPNALVD